MKYEAVLLLTIIYLVNVLNGTLVLHPDDVSAKVGSTIKFICGTSEPDPINWMFKSPERSDSVRIYIGGTVSADYMWRFTVKSFHTGEYTLIIDNVSLSDAGQYNCVDRAGLGPEEASAELTVFRENTTSGSVTVASSIIITSYSSRITIIGITVGVAGTVVLCMLAVIAGIVFWRFKNKPACSAKKTDTDIHCVENLVMVKPKQDVSPTSSIASQTSMLLEEQDDNLDIPEAKIMLSKGQTGDEKASLLAKDPTKTNQKQPSDDRHPPIWGGLKKKNINILLLGETGVGKSTWINGFANYFTYETLAKVNPVLTLIPIRYIITNRNCEQQVISMSENMNNTIVEEEKSSDGNPNEKEPTEPGQSRTQMPKTYRFTFDGVQINLIDTPGFGDVRGSKQDDANLHHIMRHLLLYKEIHAICILLKPNTARLNVIFTACIEKLLNKFGKEASENIVFCFTNTRGTLYRPGDTYAALATILENRKDSKINLCRDTMYCTDNEAVRYLAETRCGIKFDEKEVEYMNKSWNQSLKENERMLKFVSSLTPYLVNQNETRRRLTSTGSTNSKQYDPSSSSSGKTQKLLSHMPTCVHGEKEDINPKSTTQSKEESPSEPARPISLQL